MLPERNAVTMTAPFMRAYTELLVKTCHGRGAHAMGGMAAFIPSRRDAEVNAVALAKVRDDKTRESGDGFDGSWVAHPDLVPVCREVFDARARRRGPTSSASCATTSASPPPTCWPSAKTPGVITEAGLRNNVSVGLQYLANWLGGNGAVAIFNLMEDAATAEISRSQVWQWLHNDITLDDGPQVTTDLVERIIGEELATIAEQCRRRLRRGRLRPGRGPVQGGRAGRRLRRVPDPAGLRADALSRIPGPARRPLAVTGRRWQRRAGHLEGQAREAATMAQRHAGRRHRDRAGGRTIRGADPAG